MQASRITPPLRGSRREGEPAVEPVGGRHRAVEPVGGKHPAP